MKTYKQHPLSAAWQPLGEDEFKELCDSIDANGLLDRIVLYEGMILDGMNRYRACQELNIKNPPMMEYEGNDPFWFVVSKNFNRRHDSPSLRAMSITKMINWCEESNHASQYMERFKDCKFTDLTNKQIAEWANVSESTIYHSKAVLKAIPEVQDKVTSGEIAVYEGAKLSKLSPEEQKEAVSKLKERKKSAPKPKKESDTASSFDSVPLFEYEKLQAKYDEMESNYQVMAAELESCNAIRSGEQMDHFKKLNQQLVAVTASRDEWQNKCSELTRQVNYLNAKLKKLKE